MNRRSQLTLLSVPLFLLPKSPIFGGCSQFGDDGSESSDAEGMEEEDGFPGFAAGEDDDRDLEETGGFDDADSEEEDREEKGRKGKKSAQTATGKRKSSSVFADASEFEEILAKAGSEDANVKQVSLSTSLPTYRRPSATLRAILTDSAHYCPVLCCCLADVCLGLLCR